MRFNRYQIELIAKYFADLSKIIVASIVVVYFVPVQGINVTLFVFIGGIFAAILCVLIGVFLARQLV